MRQDFQFDLRSGHIGESTSEGMNKWSTKSLSLSNQSIKHFLKCLLSDKFGKKKKKKVKK